MDVANLYLVICTWCICREIGNGMWTSWTKPLIKQVTLEKCVDFIEVWCLTV